MVASDFVEPLEAGAGIETVGTSASHDDRLLTELPNMHSRAQT